MHSSLRRKLQERGQEAQSLVQGEGGESEVTTSQLSKLTSNKFNDKVDTKFSQMHSHFILLKEKENKLNFEMKKEVILKQKSQNLPEHIMEKYSSTSRLPSQLNTSYGRSKQHFGSLSRVNKSIRTHSPERANFKSAFRNKINSALSNSKKTQQTPTHKGEDESLREGEFAEIKEEALMRNEPVHVGREGLQGSPLTNVQMHSGGGSEGLKNMSVNKIHNRFNKMITEFDNIEVNQSYLDSGFKNMKMNFGDIHSQKDQENLRNSNCRFFNL